MANARDVTLDIVGNDKTRAATASAGNNFDRLARKIEKNNGKMAKFTSVSNGVTKAALAMGTAAASAGPALGVAALGVGALGTAVVSAGAALGVFGAVAKTAFTEIQDQSEELKKLEKGTAEYAAALAKLDPQQRKAIASYDKMTGAWTKFVDKNKPATFNILQRGFAALTTAVPKLQPLFDVGAAAAGRFVDMLARFTSGGGLDRLVKALAGNATSAINDFAKVFTNLGTAFGNMAKVFDGSGPKITGWLVKISEKFAAWSAGDGFSKFMDKASENGPKVANALGQIAQAAIKIAGALTPLAPITAAVAIALGSLIDATPPGVITAIVGGFIAYSVAVKAVAAYSALATAAQWAYNAALTANPIGIVVVAIAGLVAGLVLLWKNSQKAREVMTTAFAGIANVVLDSAEIMLKAYQQITDKVLSMVETTLRALGKIPGNGWADRAADDVAGFRDSVNSGFNKAIDKTNDWQRSVNKMPKIVKLKGDIASLEQKINRAKARLREPGLTRPEASKIRAEINQLEGAVGLAKRRLASVQSKTVTITVQTKFRGRDPRTGSNIPLGSSAGPTWATTQGGAGYRTGGATQIQMGDTTVDSRIYLDGSILDSRTRTIVRQEMDRSAYRARVGRR